MNVVRYEPWVLMNRLSRDLERLFHAPADYSDETRSSVVDWVPAVDIKEEDKQFVLHADLPGVDAKDIDVSLEKGELTIRGKRASASRDEKDGYRRVERVSGEFFRRFSLPDTADSSAVKAKFVNGVLEVQIPKQPTVLPRRVSVETH
ncbi:MAG TPA: Hsp20/alpha crystallin family protein [Steroidobacteraceae bacterium]|nr:Hsp20/alpha crystallin family protein [Steroidobacteraceae bacterium]